MTANLIARLGSNPVCKHSTDQDNRHGLVSVREGKSQSSLELETDITRKSENPYEEWWDRLYDMPHSGIKSVNLWGKNDDTNLCIRMTSAFPLLLQKIRRTELNWKPAAAEGWTILSPQLTDKAWHQKGDETRLNYVYCIFFITYTHDRILWF